MSRLDRVGGRQELRHVAAVQYEHHQFLALRTGLGDARDHHFIEVQARRALRNILEIVRVVVLSVDENNFLGAAYDVKPRLVNHAEIARIEPAVGVDRGGGCLGIAVVAARHAGAANQNMSYLSVRQTHA